MIYSRSVYITGIRVIATNLVGNCSDYQIIYCAQKAKILSEPDRMTKGLRELDNLPTPSLQFHLV